MADRHQPFSDDARPESKVNVAEVELRDLVGVPIARTIAGLKPLSPDCGSRR